MKPVTLLGSFFRHFISKYIPKILQTPDFSETREKITPPTREIKTFQKPENSTIKPEFLPPSSPEVHQCPYCLSKNVVKRGLREKKYETQQRYLCNACQRSFVPQKVKGKSFPLKVILDRLSLYNLGFTLEEASKRLKEKFGLRLYDFKCAWFDENSYFEFFPLHVVYKLRQRAREEHPDQIKFDIADIESRSFSK